MKSLISLLLLLLAGPLYVKAQRVVHIETNQPTARVFADSTFIGVASESPFSIEMTVERITVVQPAPDMWSGAPFVFDLGTETEITLKALFPLSYKLDLDPMFTAHIAKPNADRAWITYAAATTSILAGVLAIHLRTKADNRFDDYLDSGSASLKRKVKRLDLQSGAALGVMQIGVGVIAFRLIF